jgi:hypothetical protein
MVFLVLLAVKLASAKPRLNLTIAAETVVALGIFSLILSIAVALYGVSDFVTEIGKRELSIDDIRRFTVPFIEGLAAAALAPFVATILRHFEASYAATESGETGLAEAARGALHLAAELRQATETIAGLNRELTGTKGAFESAVKSAVGAAGSLGTMLQTESERLRFAFQRIQAEATGLAEASDRSREAVAAFCSSMAGLSASSRDARDLLDALGKLIESVERYVNPDRSRS